MDMCCKAAQKLQALADVCMHAPARDTSCGGPYRFDQVLGGQLCYALPSKGREGGL